MVYIPQIDFIEMLISMYNKYQNINIRILFLSIVSFLINSVRLLVQLNTGLSNCSIDGKISLMHVQSYVQAYGSFYVFH